MVLLMTLPFRFSDAGSRDAGFPDEQDDCCVRAFAEATGVPYPKAHALFAENGRRERKGCMAGKLIPEVAELCGIELRLIVDREKYVTVEDVVLPGAETTLIVQIPSHAFAVKKGIVYDMEPQKATAKVRRVWQVINEPAC